MKKPNIITRGKITYVVYEDKVIVGVNDSQWVSYNPYENWNRSGITMFIEKIKKSKENEYSTASEYMSLAWRCGVRGASTRRPEHV